MKSAYISIYLDLRLGNKFPGLHTLRISSVMTESVTSFDSKECLTFSVILAHKPSTNHCTESQRLSTPLYVRECSSVTHKRNCALFHSSSGSSKITFSCSISATQLSWSSVLTPSSRSGTSMKQILYSVPYVFDLILFV